MAAIDQLVRGATTVAGLSVLNESIKPLSEAIKFKKKSKRRRK